MYGLLTYIYHRIKQNVGKYTTHVGKWMHTQEYVNLTVSYVSTRRTSIPSLFQKSKPILLATYHVVKLE